MDGFQFRYSETLSFDFDSMMEHDALIPGKWWYIRCGNIEDQYCKRHEVDPDGIVKGPGKTRLTFWIPIIHQISENQHCSLRMIYSMSHM
jgi:hypothetical protein